MRLLMGVSMVMVKIIIMIAGLLACSMKSSEGSCLSRRKPVIPQRTVSEKEEAEAVGPAVSSISAIDKASELSGEPIVKWVGAPVDFKNKYFGGAIYIHNFITHDSLMAPDISDRPLHAPRAAFTQYKLPLSDAAACDPVVRYAQRLFKIAVRSVGAERGVEGFYKMLFEPEYQALSYLDKLKVLSVQGDLRRGSKVACTGIASWISIFYQDDDNTFLELFNNEKCVAGHYVKEAEDRALSKVQRELAMQGALEAYEAKVRTEAAAEAKRAALAKCAAQARKACEEAAVAKARDGLRATYEADQERAVKMLAGLATSGGAVVEIVDQKPTGFARYYGGSD